MNITVKACDVCRVVTPPEDLEPLHAPKQAPDGSWFQHYGISLPGGEEVCSTCRGALPAFYAANAAYIDALRALYVEVEQLEAARDQALKPIQEHWFDVIEGRRSEVRSQRPVFDRWRTR